MPRPSIDKQASTRLLIGVVLTLPVVAATIWFSTRQRPDFQPSLGNPTERERTISVGGITRPYSDADSTASPQLDEQQWSVSGQNRSFYSNVATHDPSENATLTAVYEAAISGAHPEQLSPAFAPAPFDLDAYQADKERYLVLHEPGRVFQSAQPGEGVAVIEAVSDQAFTMNVGESIRLSVKIPAGMPATFTSFDIGTFDNGLASITVAAGDDGVASAAFNASPGKIGDVNILAASPVATERIKFDVYINAPQ